MYKSSVAALSALVLLTACAGPSATQGVTKAGERSGGLFGMSKADTVTVRTGEAFKGVNEVIIGDFVVGFALKKTDSAKAGGGLMGSGFGGKSTARCDLTGIDNATMQQVADAVYANFVASLEAQGVKVADRSELLNSDAFKDTTKMENPHEETQGGLFGTNGITKYFAPTALGEIRPMGDIPGVTGGFGFGNPMVGASKFASATGKKVLHVAFVVDFANTEKYGSWATSTSNINVGQGLSVIPGYTKIGIIGGEGGTFSTNIGDITLGQPTTSDVAFADVVDSTTQGEVATETVANVIGLIGGVGTNKSRSFEFKARPEDFSRASVDAIGQANTILMQKISELRQN